MDLVEAIRAGRATVDWAFVTSEHAGNKLRISVMRDALKVDNVRWPATAIDLQRVADELGAMLLTPKVVDLIWLEAGRTGTQFNPVINHRYPGHAKETIVADMPVIDVSGLVDDKIAEAGDTGGVIASVGKYWVLTNKLLDGKFGAAQACNYGWHSTGAPYGAVTGGLKVWQTIGSRHNNEHIDPSQVVRLMHRISFLTRPGAKEEVVDLHKVATDPVLAPLISHEGVLRVLRQPGVPDPQPIA